ncbi:MAG: TIM barrel protein [Spirochaetota bacterium]
MTMIAKARLLGAGKIIGLDTKLFKLELAKEFGADMTIDISRLSDDELVEYIRDETDLNKGLECVKKLGYTGVELSLLDSNKIDQKRWLTKLEELNLKVYTIATGQTYYTDGCSLYAEEKNKRAMAIERIKAHLDLAAQLSSMVIIGGIRGRTTGHGLMNKKIKESGKNALMACVEYAEQKGTILLLEPINRYETNIVNTMEEGLKLIAEIDSHYLKLLPDTFHMNIEERSIEESIVKAGSHIGYIHFADNNRLAPGWGHIDFSKIVSSLKQIKYKGPLGIEVLPQPDDFKAAEQAIHYIEMITRRSGNGDRL